MKQLKNIVIFMFAIMVVSPIYAADYKIGYVDLSKILNESPAAKAAQKKLEQEFTPRNKQLDAKEAQEDFKLRRRDELGKIENRLKEVILSVAESGNYDMIFTNSDVTYASDKSGINITEKVLKKFNSK